MATTGSGSYLPSSSLVIPTFTTLLGLTGLGSGIYSLTSPVDAIRTFGLHPPNPNVSTKNGRVKELDAFSNSMIRVYAVRNIGGALTTLGLTSFWKLSPLLNYNSFSPETVRRCLGLSLMLGTVIALGDSWIVHDFAACGDLDDSTKEEVVKLSRGHALVSVPIFITGLACFVLRG